MAGSAGVVLAGGQDLPDLPEGTVVVDDPREGKGPVQGIAAGLAALSGRADAAFVCSTDPPFLHPAFVRRVLRVLAERDGTDVALPVARGYRQARARPGPEVTIQLFGTLARGAERRSDHPRRHRSPGGGGHRILHVRRRGGLSSACRPADISTPG